MMKQQDCIIGEAEQQLYVYCRQVTESHHRSNSSMQCRYNSAFYCAAIILEL